MRVVDKELETEIVTGILEDLGPFEVLALRVVAERLLMGQAQYGQLTPERLRQYHWAKERVAEYADGELYAAFETIHNVEDLQARATSELLKRLP